MSQERPLDNGETMGPFVVGNRPSLSGRAGKLHRGPLLEVVVSTVADAVAAEEGGAGRIELVAGIEQGGLTPDLAMIRSVLAVVRIPVRVMLRDNPSFAAADEAEIRHLYSFAQELGRLGVAGLVLGFIQDGKVDLALACRLLSAAPLLNATFHRAFDQATHPMEALAALKSCEQIDRILTDGGPGDWPERARRLEMLRARARPEITVMAGGGLDAEALRLLRTRTEVREFHVGRAARLQPNWQSPVDAARVHHLVGVLKG